MNPVQAWLAGRPQGDPALELESRTAARVVVTQLPDGCRRYLDTVTGKAVVRGYSPVLDAMSGVDQERWL